MATASVGRLESEYQETVTRLRRAIQAVQRQSGAPGADMQQQASHLQATISEADTWVQRIDLKARSLPPDSAHQLASKVRGYRAEVAALRAQVEALLGAAVRDSSTASLQRGPRGTSGGSLAGGDARSRALAASERLQGSGERLQAGRQQLAEAEATGQQVLQQLQSQRESIQHTQQTMQAANGALDRGEGALQRMYNRTKWFFQD